MKTIFEYEVKLPDYSACYLINDDSSGIDESDKQAIDNYMQYYYDKADSVGGSVIIDCGEEESEFYWKPAFGLACNCFNAKIIILA